MEIVGIVVIADQSSSQGSYGISESCWLSRHQMHDLVAYLQDDVYVPLASHYIL